MLPLCSESRNASTAMEKTAKAKPKARLITQMPNGKAGIQQLTNAIKKGDPPKMPAFESKLSEEQIKALVAYVRSFKK
jgi:mono/diheme cytochrome c family protein